MSGTPRGAPVATDLRETMRRQLLASIGGWSGALIAAVPTAVFVIVDVLTSLQYAVIAAVGTALALTLMRLVMHRPVQQALSGLVGVVVAALIAEWTGQARTYFLIGIVTSFLYAVPFAASLVVRRPLVGVLWEFLDPTVADDRPDVAPGDGSDPPDGAGSRAPVTPWFRRRTLRAAYTWSTLVATAVFLARGIVQLLLYRQDATGWLAFARIVMGYPLFVVAALGCFWLVRRARREVQSHLARRTRPDPV